MKRSAWLIFILFCLLSSAAWLVPTPTESNAVLQQHALLYLLTALVSLAFERRVRWLLTAWRQWFWLSVSGMALLGLPALLAELVAGSISAYTVSAIFALLPVPMILILAQHDSNSGQTSDIRRLLAPTLIAVTGLLLLIPATLPHSTRGVYLLPITCACLIIVAIASVSIYSRLQSTTIPQALIVILSSNGCLLLAAAAITGHLSTGNLRPVLILVPSNILYLAITILLILLFRRLAPLLLSTRYLLVPLLSIVEGLVLLRPKFALQIGGGLLLMISGLIWFFAIAKSPETPL